MMDCRDEKKNGCGNYESEAIRIRMMDTEQCSQQQESTKTWPSQQWEYHQKGFHLQKRNIATTTTKHTHTHTYIHINIWSFKAAANRSINLTFIETSRSYIPWQTHRGRHLQLGTETNPLLLLLLLLLLFQLDFIGLAGIESGLRWLDVGRAAVVWMRAFKRLRSGTRRQATQLTS